MGLISKMLPNYNSTKVEYIKMAIWRNWQHARDLNSLGEIRVGSRPTIATNKMFLMAIYEDYVEKNVYHNADGRLIISLSNINSKKRKSLSYPKYLMEKSLNRYLKDNETVHHKDGNFLNNDLDNLEIINRKEHIIQDVIRNKDVVVNCAYCGKEFTIKGSTLSNRLRKDRKHYGYFCSRSCSGKFGAEIQQGKREYKELETPIIPVKYKLNGLDVTE